MYPLCRFTVQTGENWTQEQSNIFLWDIPQHKRDISVAIYHQFFFCLNRCYFQWKWVLFSCSSSSGENSFKEDKDQDSYFIDIINLFLIDPPKVTSPIPVPSASKLAFEPIFEPVPEPKSSPTVPVENRMTSKVYSRKKVAVLRLIQVQEFEPTSRNEVTISLPLLQTESKLPIAIRKETRECINRPLYPLSHVVIQKVVSVL